MASKKSLLGGVNVKVHGMSGFDKSHYNAFTAPLGAIVPMCKQLLLPGKAKLSVKVSAQLPPLASDAFLRTHLKVEAFLIPLRLCYGGFQSWFSGEHIASSSANNATLSRAGLPRLRVQGSFTDSSGYHVYNQSLFEDRFGPHSLMDYFNVKYQMINGNVIAPSWTSPQISGHKNYADFNIFPFIAYQLCCHHYYRNKLIERPYFAVPDLANASLSTVYDAAFLPYVSFSGIKNIVADLTGAFGSTIDLMNGHLMQLRFRNYGYDYFTTALPSAQDGSPMSVDTSGGSFTISALRSANALQHFAEVNQMSGPDYIQTLRARYNRAPSSAVAQKPILIGSADFPMFTSGVEQSAPFDAAAQQTGNPFEGLGARYGRAHAEGSDFVCETDVDEPCYLMVMCSLVPEANYAIGVAHDMKIFTRPGSITDLPCAELERVGMEPVYTQEVGADDSSTPDNSDGSLAWSVFGYQPRYMWHKAGIQNEVHGLFREGASLQSFIPQRLGIQGVLPSQINSAFLKVQPGDLDNVTAVSGAISQYGVMIDSAISLFVSEPLGESVMPSLVDPGAEHGQSVYLSRGGISVND